MSAAILTILSAIDRFKVKSLATPEYTEPIRELPQNEIEVVRKQELMCLAPFWRALVGIQAPRPELSETAGPSTSGVTTTARSTHRPSNLDRQLSFPLRTYTASYGTPNRGRSVSGAWAGRAEPRVVAHITSSPNPRRWQWPEPSKGHLRPSPN